MKGHLTHRPGDHAMASWHPSCGQLGRYRLLQPIGHGGTAVVHLAAAPGGRMVAIKTLSLPAAADAEFRFRLAREVSAMQRIRSRFVAEIVDADVTGSIPYMVTSLVEGPTLAQLVASEGPLRGAALQRVANGLADGLAAVHEAGIVHRDLKPSNVMIAGGQPVLIDFGIAYHADDVPLTQTGTFLGTPGYLAPEVINGQRAQEPADVHAWGTTVGFAARGEPIYGTGPYELVFCRILRADANLEGIHRDLRPLVAAALMREPSQRPTAAWLAAQTATLGLDVPELPQAIMLPGRTGTAASKPEMPNIHTVPLPAPAPTRSPDRIARQHPADFADLLPAVRYAPDPGAAHRDPAARTTGTGGTGGTGATAEARQRHPVLALAALAVAVGASYVLPVAATLAVAALVTFLRAGDMARCGLAARREARGRRAWDSALVVTSMPWVLARSVIETVLCAPVLLAAAAVATTTGTILLRQAHPFPDWAAIAATYTALLCVGPRSRAPRRELHRLLDAVASSPLGVVVTLLTAGVVAMTIAGLILIQTPPTWPLPTPPSMTVHVSGFNPARFHI